MQGSKLTFLIISQCEKITSHLEFPLAKLFSGEN